MCISAWLYLFNCYYNAWLQIKLIWFFFLFKWKSSMRLRRAGVTCNNKNNNYSLNWSIFSRFFFFCIRGAHCDLVLTRFFSFWMCECACIYLRSHSTKEQKINIIILVMRKYAHMSLCCFFLRRNKNHVWLFSMWNVNWQQMHKQIYSLEESIIFHANRRIVFFFLNKYTLKKWHSLMERK